MAEACRLVLGPRCRIFGAQPEIILALEVARGAAEAMGIRLLTLNHLTDGTHSEGSLHYLGFGADLTLSPGTPEHYITTTRAMAVSLGPDFDVLNEVDHIHVEFQPKRPMNA